MNQKSIKKFLAFLVIIAMAVSVAACATTGTPAATTTAGGTQAATTKSTAAATTAATTKPAAPTKLTLFVDEAWWAYDKWEGAIPAEFNKRANVEITVTRCADDKQLPLMVASGDMTDLVCSYRYQYMANAATSNAFDTLHKTYPAVSFPVHSVLQFVNTMSDGHYYTIGCGFSPKSEYAKYSETMSEGPGFLVREDILTKLNLKIETMNDLDTAFAAVKKAYPDMYTVTFNCIHQFGWLRQMMGVPNSGYDDQNGSLIWYIRNPGQLDFYKKVNEWYRLGYIPAENFAFTTEDQTKDLVVAGKAFSDFAYDNHGDNMTGTIKAGGGTFTMKQITKVISDKAVKYENFVGGRGLYITKSCKNVEAAYKTVAYAYGDEGMKLLMWGIEGTDYNLNAKGYPTFTFNFQGGVDVMKPRGLKFWGWLVHNAIVTSIAEVTSTSNTAAARKATAAIVKRNPAIGMIRFETDSNENVIQAKLADMIKTEQIKVFMAASESACVAAYNDMIKKADTLGMAALETYGNSKYATYKSQYDKIADNKE